MHNNLPKFFYFINEFNEDHIRKLDKRVAIIFRDYLAKYNKKLIQEIKHFCKNNKRKFFLSNNVSLAINLGLDGVYLPSFYSKLNTNKLNTKKNFLIIGSAHTVKEILTKEKQGVNMIFLSPLFKTKKNKHFLGTTKFNLLRLKTKKKIIALGGINTENIKQLKMINAFGFAGISYFNKNCKIS
jgi:thiamine-phosphate pyrophosphorylase